MENCNNGINIPQTTTEPCGGDYLSTDCVASPNALTYLDLTAGASQTQINAALVTALTFKDEQIAEIPVSNVTQDNFVRVLEITDNLLSGFGTIEEQICGYILTLPEAQRTILETDSKLNVRVIQYTPVLLYNTFERGASSNIDLCGNVFELTQFPTYVEKISDDNRGLDSFAYGSPVFQDPELTIILPSGNYDTSRGRLFITNGVSSTFSCK